MPKPYPVDITTDDMFGTGKLEIYGEADGDGNDLRALLADLIENRPMDFFKRGDIHTNVGEPDPGEG